MHGNGDTTTEEGDSTDSEDENQLPGRHEDEGVQPIMPTPAVLQPLETQSLPLAQTSAAPLPKAPEQLQELEVILPLPASASDALAWVREIMPGSASCLPSESRKPSLVYLEALRHEMPPSASGRYGLPSNDSKSDPLAQAAKQPAATGCRADPTGKNVSGEAGAEMNPADYDDLERMMQVWGTVLGRGDAGGDAVGDDDDNDGDGGVRAHKKSWVSRCIPRCGKLPADPAAQKPLCQKSVGMKSHSKGIFGFFPSRRRET